jgi:SAM-dependent methyltransferase
VTEAEYGNAERRKVQAASFGAVATAYDRARPSYPDEAVDWLLPAGARRVLDLGAGTGKLTRGLRDRGLEVIAVEPSAGMREQLARVLPDVTILDGPAEQIPVADHAVDAVLVAQAWHWVDKARAVPEAARVLVPGGRLGLLWNIRDERVGWVAELGRILRGPNYSHSDQDSADPSVGPPFGPVERFDLEWSRRTSADEIIDLVSSRSYIITMAPPERSAVLDRVRHLLGTHPDLAGTAGITLPYVTRCSRAQLPS